MGLVLSEEAQNVVGIAAVHKAPHEVILSRDTDAVRTLSLSNLRIEIIMKRRRDKLISIHNQDPRMGGCIYRKLACRFYYRNSFLLECYYLAPITLGYLKRVVRAFHITDDYLIKVLDGV